MMKGKLIIGLTCMVLFFVSCNAEKEKRLKKVEGLEGILDGTKEVLYSVDTAKVFQYRRNLIQDIKIIQSYRDTIPKEKAIYIDNYNSLSKAFNRLYVKYPEFQKEIAFSEKQLENLKADVKNQNVPEGKFSEYYNSEMDAVVQLNSAIESTVNGANLVSEKYEEMHPKIEEYINEMDSTKMSTQ